MGIGGRRGGGVGDALRVKNVTLVVLPTKRGIKKRKEKERSVLVDCPDGT